ncbi:MAG: HlyD family efflux transporter periplasmic adaptor subunit [Chloroflexi bacterium]|nr:HlyD family efflux transporter periplasmic adaptor subunit [Chloroflexota bacterium]
MNGTPMRVLGLLVVLLALGGAAWAWATYRPQEVQAVAQRLNLEAQTAEDDAAIRASGSVEADESVVSPELGGRVLRVLAAEGQSVQAGDALVELDAAVLLAQLGQALAAQQAAEAHLEEVSAGPRDSLVRRAEAVHAQAKAQEEAALSAWWGATAVRDNPQELEARIDETRTQVRLAQERWEAAQAQVKAAEIVRDRYEGDGSLEGKARHEIESKRVEAAQAEAEAARQQVAALRSTLSLLLEMRETPVVLQASVTSAEAQAQVARAAVRLAQTGVDLAKAGPRPEEVEMAAAQVEQAEATVALIQAQMAKQTLRAPMDGVVSMLGVHEGEVALPGSTVARLANLETVELVIYVPEARIGRVQVGQEAEVTIDAFPAQRFVGQVVYISPQAEFTPRNVQTVEERVRTVFAVRIRLPNPHGVLKPGMPADAVLRLD